MTYNRRGSRSRRIKRADISSIRQCRDHLAMTAVQLTLYLHRPEDRFVVSRLCVVYVMMLRCLLP